MISVSHGPSNSKGRINLDGGTDKGLIVGFVDGVDSYSHPAMVKATQARWLENAVTRGALLQCRPGYLQRFKFDCSPGTVFRQWWDAQGNPPLQPQMLQYFAPTLGEAQLVFAVSGSVWACIFNPDGSLQSPFMISAAAFNPYCLQLVGCVCVQTATIISGNYANNITPQNLLVIQDGVNRACIWNGTSFYSCNPGKKIQVAPDGSTLFPAGFNETIVGTWMAFSGNRLWVCQERRLRAGLGPWRPDALHRGDVPDLWRGVDATATDYRNDRPRNQRDDEQPAYRDDP